MNRVGAPRDSAGRDEAILDAVPWTSRAAGALPDALLLDLDGVVFAGGLVLPGAVAAPGAVRDRGGAVRFVTNNAFRTPHQVATRLVELGVPAVADEVVTSAVVAVDLIAERIGADPGAVVAVVGGPGITAPLAAAGLHAAPAVEVATGDAAVLVQGFSPETGWADLAAATRHVRSGTWWVATNLDPTLPTEDGPAPGNGSLVRAVATAAGREPDVVAGKPDPVMVTRALPPSLRANARMAILVGDRLDTDIAAARTAGVTAMLVLSGVHGPGDLLTAQSERRPHLLGHDLRDLGVEHPDVEVPGEGVARCRGTTARVSRGAGGAVDRTAVSVQVDRAPGGCVLDVVRALCSATWSLVDPLPAPDRDAVFTAVLASGVLPSADDLVRDGCGQDATTLPGDRRAG